MAFDVQYIISLKDKFSGKLNKANRQADKLNSKFGKLQTSSAGLGKAFALLGGTAAALSVLRDVGQTVIDFDDKIAELGSILGKTGDELDFFKEASIELSDQSTKTANEIVDAFKLVGSAKPELLKNAEGLKEVTEAAITLSEAAKLDVPTASKALAGALNQFGLPASNASRVINALAAGSKEGAAAIPEIAESIKNFGAIAADANLSVEDSVGLIETLAEKDLKGAEAGVKLRNVILNLKSAGLGFSSGQFRMNEALEEARKKFEAIEDPVERNNAKIKLFQKQNIQAGEILINNVDKFERFTDAVTGTTVAFDQASQNSSTLAARVNNLGKSWDNLVLSVNEGSGVISKSISTVTSSMQRLLDSLRNINEETDASFATKFTALFGVGFAKTAAQGQLARAVERAKELKEQQKSALVFGTEQGGQSIFDRFGAGTGALGTAAAVASKGKKTKIDAGISGVKAAAPKVFNINIDKQIETFNVNTANMKESASAIKQMVQQVLLTAVTDTSIQSE